MIDRLENEEKCQSDIHQLKEAVHTSIINLKEMKNKGYVGEEKLFYHHLTEAIFNLQSFGIKEEIIGEKKD